MTLTRHVFHEYTGSLGAEGQKDQTAPTDLGLSHDDLRALDAYSHQLAPGGVFKIRMGSIKASHYVGVVVFRNLQLEILPKFIEPKGGDDSGIFKNLLTMLAHCPDVAPWQAGAAALATSTGSFLEFIIYGYAVTVNRTIAQGVRQASRDALQVLRRMVSRKSMRPLGRAEFSSWSR